MPLWPESITMPMVRHNTHGDDTATLTTYMVDVLKISNMICVIFSLLALDWISGGTRSTAWGAPWGPCTALCKKMLCQIFSMSSPVGDDALLNGVLEGQDSPLALGLVTHG